MSHEEEFSDVVDALQARYAADRLPRPLRDGVLRELDRRSTLRWIEGIAQIAAAALLVAGLVLLFAKSPNAGAGEGGVGAAQDAEESRLEDLKREIARVKAEIRALKEELARRETAPAPPTPAPPVRSATTAKVTAVAGQIDLVVISIGREDGVSEGELYWIHRGGKFVAQIKIDRVDRKWSAGKVLYKLQESQVGDEVQSAK